MILGEDKGRLRREEGEKRKEDGLWEEKESREGRKLE